MNLPKTPLVVPLSGTTWKPRIYFDYNITPVFNKNPHFAGGNEPDANGRYAWERATEPQEYMLQCGFTAALMAYAGVMNRSPWWWNNDTWAPVKKVLNRFEYLAPGPEGNLSDPVQPRAIAAVCALAKEAKRFDAPVKPYRPIWTNIEGTQTYNKYSFGQMTLPEAVQTAKNWLAMAKEFRRLLTFDMEFYSYMGHLLCYCEHLFPDLGELLEVEREHARQYSGYTGGCYNWDMPYANGGESFYAAMERHDLVIKRYYPEFADNKVAFLNPTWQVYWGDTSVTDKPLPYDLWKAQVDFVTNRGWNIFMWLGNLSELPGIKPHIDYLLRFK